MKTAIANNLEQARIYLQDRWICSSDMGYRTFSKENTLDKIRALVNSSAGIVSNLEEVTCYDKVGIPVFLAIPSVLEPEAKGEVRRIPCHWGKGVDRDQAQISALSETIERYSAKMLGNESLITASYKDIKRDAVSPERFIHIKKGIYKRYKFLTKYCETLELEWVAGYSLISKRSVFVPANFVFFPYVTSNKIYLSFTDTYGLGAGNTIEEAILTGMFELIESDAITINFKRKIPAPLIDLDSINDTVIRDLIKKFQNNGIKVYIQNVTTDIEVYTFQTLLVDENGYPTFALGFGASLSPSIAIIRSLTEAAQNRCSQRLFKKLFVKTSKKSAFNHILGNKKPRMSFRDLTDRTQSTIVANIETCIDSVRKVVPDTDILIVNLTRTATNFPVVRVLIPDLQPGDFGNIFSTPRLYMVSQQLRYKSGVQNVSWD